MKQLEEKKYTCGLCQRSFSNGRILGGHMRSHSIRNPVREKSSLENGDHASEGYGLRENPKKSLKFSGLNHGESSSTVVRLCCKGLKERALCKECDKAFKSAKSVRVHSGTVGVSSGGMASSKADLAIIALPETEMVRRKRSKRTRCSNSCASFSSLNESASGFETDQEEMEVAISLIMLSRGVQEWDGLNLIGQFNNSSVCSEPKPLKESQQMRVVEGDVDFDGEELVKTKESKRQKLELKKIDFSEYQDEMMCSVEKNVELEVPKYDDKLGFLLFDDVPEEGIHGCQSRFLMETAPTQNLKSEIGSELTGLGSVKSVPTQKFTSNACDTELMEDSCSKRTFADSDSEVTDDCWKRNKFICRICSKTFATYQALGGHQTSHRTVKTCRTLKVKNFQKDVSTSPEADGGTNFQELEQLQDPQDQELDGGNFASHEPSKGKEYKCLLCFKIFASHRALGGHKKVHVAKARDELRTQAMKQDDSDICNLLGMKLPEMLTNGDIGLKPCSAVSTAANDMSLVGLVAN